MANRGRPRKTTAEHAAAGTYRRDRHGPLPGTTDECGFLRGEVARIKLAIIKTAPGEENYNSLLVSLKRLLEMIEKLRLGSVATPPVAAVVSRPKTALDRKGPPPKKKVKAK